MAQAFQDISWEGVEYVVRKRNAFWYVGLFIVGIGLGALSVWQHWWTFLVLIILIIVAILVTSLRPPRKIKYTLTKEGLTEGSKLHKFEDFKAFGIQKENSHFSAVLIPKKRFGLSIKAYFPGEVGEVLVDSLGSRLPMEEIKPDFLDKMANFLRI